MSQPIIVTGLRPIAVGIGVLGALLVPVAPVSAEATYDPDALAVVERALGRYRAVSTYQDRFTYEIDVKGDDTFATEGGSTSLVFSRPNRFVISDSSNFSIYSDGRRQWTHYDVLYTESAAPAALDVAAAAPEFLRGAGFPHPLVTVLSRPGDELVKLFPVRALTGVSAEIRNDVAGKRVTGSVALLPQVIKKPMPFSAWFADGDGLLREIRLDATELMRFEMAYRASIHGEEPKPFKSCEFVMTFDKIVVDDELPAHRFTFKPGVDDKAVDTISFEAYQLSLIGRPAPDFTGRDFDGKPFSLKAMRGRVVVFDFWASWCQPCIMVMPALRSVASSFKDKPVSIVGVNSDAGEQLEAAKDILKRQRLTIAQVHDADGSINEAYRVVSIPCTAVIDRKGIVQQIHSGFNRQLASELTREIRTLLDGGTLLEGFDLQARLDRGQRRRPGRPFR